MSWLESRDYDRYVEDRREREFERVMGYDIEARREAEAFEQSEHEKAEAAFYERLRKEGW